jgi:hypothetical protein
MNWVVAIIFATIIVVAQAWGQSKLLTVPIPLDLLTTQAARTYPCNSTSSTGSLATCGIAPSALTDGATITVTTCGALSCGYTLTLTGNNHTLANPSSVAAGQHFEFAISTGTGFTGFATGSQYKFAGGAPTWPTAASKKSIMSCWADTTTTINCGSLLDVQ